MEVKLHQSRYHIGRINELEVLRLVSIGAYLEWDNESGILLPLRYLPQGLEVGQKVEVFVYHDNEGRLIATTLKPYAQVGETAYLECVGLSSAGAFVDWGIHKDLFVPFTEQKGQMEEGKSYVVHLYIDRISGKIVGSAKLNKHIGNVLPSYAPGDRVQALAYERNDAGLRCIVDHIHWGIIYEGEYDEELRRGDNITAYMTRIREDGRIDLSLRPVGYDRVDGDTTKLIRLLHAAGGKLPIGDKSPAEEVLRLTGLSKKSFKMVCGALYKKRKLRLTPHSIELI